MGADNNGERLVDPCDKLLASISDLSKSDEKNSDPLVESNEKIYNFDKITQGLFPNDKLPASCDGMRIHVDAIELIEFKQGFRRLADKIQNFNPKAIKCPCKCGPLDSCVKVLKNQFVLEKKNLISSLHAKAAESYITLTKHILGNQKILADNCLTLDGADKKIYLTIVIDGPIDDAVIDTHEELAEKSSEAETISKELHRGLSKFKCKCQAGDVAYCYDDIYVMSPADFQKTLPNKGENSQHSTYA